MSEVTLPDERVGPVAKLIIVVTTIVALVVGRLFDLVRPSAAYFGEKDFQQLRLVQDMVDADRKQVQKERERHDRHG